MKRTGLRLRLPLPMTAAVTIIFACQVYGQGFATISGNITDASGGVLPNAHVTATQVSTGVSRTALSNSEGIFVLPALPPATYSLKVAVTGFRDYRQDGILLQADQSATINVHMELGAASENITVQAEATAVDTTTATLKQVVEQKSIVDLPLNGRNAAVLTTLVAGTLPVPNSAGWDQGAQKTFPGVVLVSTNGSQGNTISYMLDGGNNVDEYTNVNQPFPFPDALQEFSVQTSNYSARYGNNAGGVVNIITKSGTNSIRGDLFEFNRNAVFNARNFFASRRDQLKRNQFGGTIGGPVVIPGLYNGKEKTFFFGGYQGTRIRNITTSNSAFVPTPAELNGDFSAFLDKNNPANTLGRAVQLLNPFTGQPIPGNVVDPGQFDPASLKIARSYLPQAGTSNGQVFYANPVIQNFNEFVLKGDHSISEKDRISARYYWDRFAFPPVYNQANILTFAVGATLTSQNFLFQETHSFRPNLLNEFRFNISPEQSHRGPASNAPSVTDFGVNMPWQPADKDIYRVAASGFFSFGANPSATFSRKNFGFGDDLSWIKGKHTLTFGGSIEHSAVDITNHFMEPGSFTFSGDYSGLSLADFLFGKIRTFSENNGEYKNIRNIFAGVYFQDDFRVSRRLTLNLGLRYEPFFPWNEIHNRREWFSIAAYMAGRKSTQYTNAPPGLLFPGDPGVPERGTVGTYTDFAPRIGFAYDLTGSGRTSLRGGVGAFYDTRMDGNIDNYFSDITPFSFALTLTPPPGRFSNPLAGVQSPFPTPFPPPNNAVFPTPLQAYTFDPNGIKPPVTYNWNLTLEHQFASDWFGRIAYAGSHASHILIYQELNPAIYTPGSSLSTDQRRALQPFGSVTQFSPIANSSYNSLQVTAEKRFGRRLPMNLRANYTYSKSIDNVPVGGTYQAMPNFIPGAGRFERGPSNADRTHRLVFSYDWQLAALAHSNSFTRTVLGGWQLTGIFTAMSGDAFTVLAGRDVSQTGIGQDRADLVAQPYYGPGACNNRAPCVNWLVPSAFKLAATGSFGNIGKDSIRGPNFYNLDMGLFKNFPITERYRVQFRAEFFNALNRANFNDPTASLNSGGFGAITSAMDPRIGQLALKLYF